MSRDTLYGISAARPVRVKHIFRHTHNARCGLQLRGTAWKTSTAFGELPVCSSCARADEVFRRRARATARRKARAGRPRRR